MDFRAALAALLAVAAASGAFYLFVFPHLSGEARADLRQSRIAVKPAARRNAEREKDAAARRKQVTDSLKELEQRNAAKKRVTLETRIARAGLDLTRSHYLLASAASAALVMLLLFALSGSPLTALAGAPIGGFGLPNFWLSRMTNKRMNRFALEFPNALDVIVRGVRAGLPLGDCVQVIASDAAEPVRSEFRRIIEAQSLGLSIAEAIERMPDRIPTAEANFFAIVIAIQQKSGGNLAEALQNLGRVLRERKKMRDKVHAMSSEAKASASIIGSLPVVVAGLVYLTSPHYIEMLWTTDTGRIVLAVCAATMAFGIFIMKKMIAFDI